MLQQIPRGTEKNGKVNTCSLLVNIAAGSVSALQRDWF